MLLDLLSSSNQISFNISVAQTFGLHTAIYLSELMAINEKAIKKNKIEKIDNKDYFTVNRKYITERTTIKVVEQKNIDASLSKIKIISIKENNVDTINLDIDILASVLGTEIDPNILNNITEIVGTKKKKTAAELKAEKTEGILYNLRKAINTTVPELRIAYDDWLDVYNTKFGRYPAKAQLIETQNIIDAYTNRNLDMALEILKIAILNGYQDIHWAIKLYEDSYKSKKQFTSTNNNVIINNLKGKEVAMQRQVAFDSQEVF